MRRLNISLFTKYRSMVSARLGLRLLYIIEIRYHIADIALRVVDTNVLGEKYLLVQYIFLSESRGMCGGSSVSRFIEVLQGT